ncbi:tyrosine-protein phosphatase [Phenylobacterium sp. 58.2.17]|uniref:tyrosine-protein phosphatase n=1 Tax=Phenylobacterium sp. 58.2.17 TaxID=2969306 RepID=UPI002265331C|nr:tyrosine-protein phosphatase [Phenylobacterium sp. 58.2.17]MCX7586697.1 tyrosine-protein phosphatase [Phenylobacterium sp. 58.2.17]
MTTIKFEAIDNFRDFGGYSTACGRGLKAGRLFRSANHAYATDGDLAALRDLGVGVIVDLRRRREREREPSRRWEGFAGAVIENDIDGPEHDWADALKAAPAVNADWFFNDSLGFYRAAPHAERMIDLFSRYFATLAATEGAVVVHCAAGKDRTGMICALTHHIAGVHRDDTMADYLATNAAADVEKRIEFLGPWIHDLTGVTVDDAGLRQAVSVNEAFLAEAFAAMTESHGSIDNYLAEVLGVDTALRDRIAARILG